MIYSFSHFLSDRTVHFGQDGQSPCLGIFKFSFLGVMAMKRACKLELCLGHSGCGLGSWNIPESKQEHDGPLGRAAGR